jgi:hypothetical protein
MNDSETRRSSTWPWISYEAADYVRTAATMFTTASGSTAPVTISAQDHFRPVEVISFHTSTSHWPLY